MAAGDDLNDPLGLGRTPRRRPIPFRLLFFASAGLVLIGGTAFLNFRGDPLGGEPHAVAVITPSTPARASASATPTAHRDQSGAGGDDVTGTIASPAGDDTAAEIEQKSGVKVVRNGGAKPPGALIIEVPQLLAQRLASAPDLRLVERSRYGLLPRMGKDGTRPADVYARPWPAGAAKPNAPRIALVVGGVGLSESATATAIGNLPGPITLAFAPYGDDLKGKVTQARDAGHEVILQLPMEPIDYPRTNPGPHALLATASVAENTDNLHWLLSRFTGYTGVANFLGAKFTSAPAAFDPVLREIGERGLFYIDDGASARSIGLTLAKEVGLPAVRADLILDAPTQADTIDANLAKLEAIAREKGTAIGMASDLPKSLEKLARFAQTAAARGIVLIPLSAAVSHAAAAQNTPAHDDVARDAGAFRDP
ncbi:MAG: divergent polysaccharide deacetylase family protein [Methylovirgula sp.]